MIKFNVKSLILAFFLLGGMVTAGVASAIPERYVIEGNFGRVSALGRTVYDQAFHIDLDFDMKKLDDPTSFKLYITLPYLYLSALGPLIGNSFGDFDSSNLADDLVNSGEPLPFRFDISKSPHFFSLYTQADESTLSLNFEKKGNSIVSSNVTYNNAESIGIHANDGVITSLSRSVALPTPSSALLMLPLLLFVFRRSLLNIFSSFKPLRMLAA